MPTFKDDYSFGTNEESKQKGVLEKVFGVTLHHRGGSSTIDYDDGQTFYLELKSRRVKHDQYDTTIIGANKVKFAADNPTRTCWFCWNYTDGIYGLKYDKKVFDTFKHGEYWRGSRPDYHNHAQHVYWIPHSLLTKLA